MPIRETELITQLSLPDLRRQTPGQFYIHEREPKHHYFQNYLTCRMITDWFAPPAEQAG